MFPFGPGRPRARPTNLVAARLDTGGHERTRHGRTRADTTRAGARGLGGESWVIALIQLTKTPDITSTAAPGVGARAHVSDDGREQRHVLGDVMPRGWAQTCPDRSRRTSSDGRSHGEMPEAGGLRQRERAEDGVCLLCARATNTRPIRPERASPSHAHPRTRGCALPFTTLPTGRT